MVCTEAAARSVQFAKVILATKLLPASGIFMSMYLQADSSAVVTVEHLEKTLPQLVSYNMQHIVWRVYNNELCHHYCGKLFMNMDTIET